MTIEQIISVLDTLDQSVEDDLSVDYLVTLSTLVYDNLFDYASNQSNLDVILFSSLDLNNILIRYLLHNIRR